MSLSADDQHEATAEDPDKELIAHLTASLQSLCRAFRAAGRYDLLLKIVTQELVAPDDDIRSQIKTNEDDEDGESGSEVTPSPSRSRSRSRNRLQGCALVSPAQLEEVSFRG